MDLNTLPGDTALEIATHWHSPFIEHFSPYDYVYYLSQKEVIWHIMSDEIQGEIDSNLAWFF